MKTIGIIGTRKKNQDFHYKKVYAEFKKIYEPGDRIVSGGCPVGGDKFAWWIAKKEGLTMITHYPNWAKYGKSAGFKRNILIAEDADVLIACVSDERVGGTEDTIKKFNNKEKLVVVE